MKKIIAQGEAGVVPTCDVALIKVDASYLQSAENTVTDINNTRLYLTDNIPELKDGILNRVQKFQGDAGRERGAVESIGYSNAIQREYSDCVLFRNLKRGQKFHEGGESGSFVTTVPEYHPGAQTLPPFDQRKVDGIRMLLATQTIELEDNVRHVSIAQRQDRTLQTIRNLPEYGTLIARASNN